MTVAGKRQSSMLTWMIPLVSSSFPYHHTQTLQRYVHAGIFSSASRHGKTARLQSAHARSFSAAGLMMDCGRKARSRLKLLARWRPTVCDLQPYCLFCQPYIARLDSNVSEVRCEVEEEAFLTDVRRDGAKAHGRRARTFVCRLHASTTTRLRRLFFFSTISFLGDLNALSGIPLALRNLLRGAFRDTVMAQDAAILDASGSRWLLLDCQVIR